MYELLTIISAFLTVLLGYVSLATFSFGSILALIISWSRNASVRWAIFHGWLGWFYVLYYCFRLRRRSQFS
jgi:hypothetical protein